MQYRLRRFAVVVLALCIVLASGVWQVQGQARLTARSVWELQLPRELQGRLYETVIVPGEVRVIATTPGAILSLDEGGGIAPLVPLELDGPNGETATLAADGSRAGILIHRLHAILGFRLVNLRGETLVSIEAPLQFHYRLAPDGTTFVGIDAGGQHVRANAKRFVYRFYDEAGDVMAEVVSEDPQPVDSAYTPDGVAFVLNNGEGLAAHRITDGERLWQVAMPARLFTPASAESRFVAAVGTEERNVIQTFRDGALLWRFALEGAVHNLTVSPNGAFVLATDGSTAHLLSPQGGAPLWSLPMPDQALVITSAAVDNRGVVALGAQNLDLTRSLVLILDGAGEIIFERELSHRLSNAWIPTVQFDVTGTSLSIRTLEELILVVIG